MTGKKLLATLRLICLFALDSFPVYYLNVKIITIIELNRINISLILFPVELVPSHLFSPHNFFCKVG